ncbi:uncharacterized protein EKO05_0008881 [Ascochyta rabiei]|uniref:Uncharacterized protein n=1 Tax=Didymella rabiei TaxID=5454 RepID=A0A163AQC0_DIDRA|nr:uncharacterized protein EKO05_0008881 [Ascochyta rabiei]KZM21324.1 hypothetical protein ST47_g7514 [Ascochyta rabiei]UPX18587.1 hypothetical protein EKO05_0008881 [Ascochyta rabiei]
MGWFSSDEKSVLATHPVNPDVTTSRLSGAEQDRYGEHFSQIGQQAGEKIREGIHDITHARGSGAEQDRFGQHLGVGQSGYNAAKAEAQSGYNKAKAEAQSGYDKAKSVAERALHAKGNGAEQDRYAAHFGGLFDPVRASALSIISSGGDVSKANYHWLGHDGRERAKFLAAQKGTTGSEQDRYGAHFTGFGQQAAQSIKDEWNKLKN